MWLLDFFQGFIDLFRSRYVRYLESEIVRLRQETAALNSTLMSSKGITVVPSPDFQDLQARGNTLRQARSPERTMKPAIRSGTHARWRRQQEAKDRQLAMQHEEEIREQKEKKAAVSAT